MPDFYNQNLEVDDLDMIGELKRNDIIVLTSSTVKLENPGFGFIKKMDKFLGKSPDEERSYFIDAYKRSIRNSSEWLENIQEKSVMRKIPIDSMITIDATYMANKRLRLMISNGLF